MYEYNAIITNIVDGDTFDLKVDLGFHIFIDIRIRLLDIDTPEKRGTKEKELGLICTNYAKRFLNKEVIIQSIANNTELKTDSFGRWLCYLQFKDTGEDIRNIYNNLGINKKFNTYSIESVKRLKEE